jgi:hypothetical protein
MVELDWDLSPLATCSLALAATLPTCEALLFFHLRYNTKLSLVFSPLR